MVKGSTDENLENNPIYQMGRCDEMAKQYQELESTHPKEYTEWYGLMVEDGLNIVARVRQEWARRAQELGLTDVVNPDTRS